MSNAPLFRGPETILATVHAATVSYAAQRARFSLFNNITIVGRGAQGWTIRATKAVAEGISRLGFDVYAGDIDCAGTSYVVRRPAAYRIVDENGVQVEPADGGYRRVVSSIDA